VGQIIVDSLAAHGIDRVFCVPGESYLGLLDALFGRDDIDTVTCRHESGAGYMAVADARLTGRPGVACVSRGPGASNAAIAVHAAEQDGAPLILLVGQVARADLRRNAFQEIDYDRMYGSIAKWTAEVREPDSIGETLLRAFHAATTGLPGPVVVALPEDVLTASTESKRIDRQAAPQAAPSSNDLQQLRSWLESAVRPLVLAGHALDVPGGRESLVRFAEAWGVPVLVSFRRHDLLPNDHPLFAGDMWLANPREQMDALRTADVLMALGTRLGDITTQGYTFPRLVRPEMRLVHVHQDPTVLGAHFACDLALASDAKSLLDALGRPNAGYRPPVEWAHQLRAMRDRVVTLKHVTVSDGIPFEEVVDAVGHALAPDAIVTLDAGTFGASVHRLIPFRPPQRFLAPISGAMGFGIPAAVAASLRDPTRQVVCFVGDGGFLMTGSELAVAAERRLPIKVIVSDNKSYGSIRVNQERQYPGRVIGTTLHNPRLDLIGQAHGFQVTTLRTSSDVSRVRDALAAPGPQLIIVQTSLEAVLPRPGHPLEPRSGS
jgi:acetolactate synthase-1/2/3 large subunit